MKSGRFLMVVCLIIGLGLGAAVGAGAEEPETYVVKPGDTLWGICQQHYGDETLWPALWEMNRYRTTNPHRINVGDVLVLYPAEVLRQVEVPKKPQGQYALGPPLTEFPKYFTYLADPAGLAATGANRIQIKPLGSRESWRPPTTWEIYEVGRIVASMEQGKPPESEFSHGRIMLSYYDDVIIAFKRDVSRILGPNGPGDRVQVFFREYPIYEEVRDEKMKDQIQDEVASPADKKRRLGKLHRFKGRLDVFARVETLRPLSTEEAKSQVAPLQEFEKWSFLAKITYSEQPISIGDRIFLFKNVYPGVE